MKFYGIRQKDGRWGPPDATWHSHMLTCGKLVSRRWDPLGHMVGYNRWHMAVWADYVARKSGRCVSRYDVSVDLLDGAMWNPYCVKEGGGLGRIDPVTSTKLTVELTLDSCLIINMYMVENIFKVWNILYGLKIVASPPYLVDHATITTTTAILSWSHDLLSPPKLYTNHSIIYPPLPNVECCHDIYGVLLDIVTTNYKLATAKAFSSSKS